MISLLISLLIERVKSEIETQTPGDTAKTATASTKAGTTHAQPRQSQAIIINDDDVDNDEDDASDEDNTDGEEDGMTSNTNYDLDDSDSEHGSVLMKDLAELFQIPRPLTWTSQNAFSKSDPFQPHKLFDNSVHKDFISTSSNRQDHLSTSMDRPAVKSDVPASTSAMAEELERLRVKIRHLEQVFSEKIQTPTYINASNPAGLEKGCHGSDISLVCLRTNLLTF